MRSRQAPSIAGSPILIGTVTVLVTVVAVFLAYNANSGLPFVPTYRVTAEVPNAASLVEGNEVRAGGKRVGVIERIVAETSGRRAYTKLSLKLDKAIQPDRERPENTPGSVLRVELDRDHYLSAGTDGEVQAMVDGRRVFTPLRLDQGTNVGVYAKTDRLVAAGLVWEEARKQLAEKAYLVEEPTGRGRVIAFAEDPNYRAFAEATELLFINAVLLGPAH